MKRLSLALLVLFATLAGLCLAGVRINTTPSVPVGLYWLTDRPATKGALAAFCPPKERVFLEAVGRGYLGPGFCPAGSIPLIKHVAALPGDFVQIEPSGVEINNQALPNSRQIKADPLGRPLPALRFVGIVPKGQVLLMANENRFSFDGRYFGLVSSQNLFGSLTPLWLFPGTIRGFFS